MTASVWKFSILLACAASFGWASDPIRYPTREARATAVVFNLRDPVSRGLAEYYAGRRGIPGENLVGLDCPLEEEISRQDYMETIERPLREVFERKGWWKVDEGPGGVRKVRESRIRFVALMRGIPLKIKTTIQPPSPETTPPPGPNGNDPIRRHDEAAIDSELAALGAFAEDPFGLLPNPYFRRFSPVLDSSTAPGLLLVCRLDAPAAETVRRMIDDSLLAERVGLYGWAYIDRRSIPESGYRAGDDWLRQAADDCWNHGIPVILDNNPATFPEGFAVTEASLYYGWYDWGAGGAMASPQFVPGAVAAHIHSFSAATLRDPDANWAAPLVTRGAAATVGNVYEPYLDLTPHLDVFNERLLQGFTFAESAWMSIKALSWMTTVVGDPLYRPFADWPVGGQPCEPDAAAGPWLALGRELRQGARSGLTQTLYVARLAREHPSGLNYEALGMLQSFLGESRGSLKSLEAAGGLYRNPAETFRTIVERLRILQGLGDKKTALALIDRTLQRTQPQDRANLLRSIRDEIAPPPPPPSPTAPPQKP